MNLPPLGHSRGGASPLVTGSPLGGGGRSISAFGASPKHGSMAPVGAPLQRPSSRAGSERSSGGNSGHNTVVAYGRRGRPPSSGLSHTVNATRKWATVLHQTSEANNYVHEENNIMESILAEQHEMVSNSDLSRMMSPIIAPYGPDGKPLPTPILAARKPPERFIPGKVKTNACSVIEVREKALGRVNTSKVNYQAMLQEQATLERTNRVKRQGYEVLIADFFRQQQALQDRFSNIKV